MTKSDIEAWLTRWFAAKAPDQRLDPSVNYIDAGIVDSFDLIVLIEEMEAELGCRFVEADFQDRRFVTLSGLVEIISEKKIHADG
jgi:acyl carrier protein